MFSTVLELTTTRFMSNRRSKFAWGKISALPRSRCCLLFSLHARVYLTLPLTKTYGYGLLFAIVCDCLRSAIVCDYMETSPLDRTWFYLLRSSAITIAGSQTIAKVCFHMIADDRKSYCDLRSAIIWKPMDGDIRCKIQQLNIHLHSRLIFWSTNKTVHIQHLYLYSGSIFWQRKVPTSFIPYISRLVLVFFS